MDDCDSRDCGLFSAPVDFIRLCEQGKSYKVPLPGSMLRRLAQAEVLHGEVGEAVCELEFFQDLQGLHVLKGTVRLGCALTCQRCFEPFDHELYARFAISCDEQKARDLRLPGDRYEFVQLDDEQCFDLRTYLEDCLLLEIPMAPSHTKSCAVQGHSWSFGHEEVPPAEHPFAVLASLKREGDGGGDRMQ